MKKFTVMRQLVLLSLTVLFSLASFAQKAVHFTESFTTLPSSYTTGDYTLPSGTWNFTAVYGESSTNSYGGTGKAARINDDTPNAQMTTPAVNTVGTISFYYRELNSGGGTFEIFKSVDGGAWSSLTTQSYSGNTYVLFSYDINDAGDNIKIKIESDGNSGHLIIDELTLTDNSGGGNIPPVIANITQSPSSNILATDDVVITADVTDSDGTVSLVQLNYGLSPGSYGTPIAMSNSGDTYTATIPAQAAGSTVYYQIYAEDNDGDGSTSDEYSYIVFPVTTTLPYTQEFTNDLGDCYTYSVSGGTKEWEWGFDGTAYMNGYNSGETEEDWLILPGIDMDSYTDVIMTFDNWYKYGDFDDDNHYLKLYYSTDYPGVGDPSTSSWTELFFHKPSGWENWTNSLVVDLSGVSGSSVYIAFKYYYISDSYRTWQIDNIAIFEGTRVNVEFQVNMEDNLPVSGDGVHIAGSFANWWDPAGIELLDGDTDDIYTTTLSLFENEEYHFKYINGNTWLGVESVPLACQASGTDNRFEIVGTSDYSIDEVCFSSCNDCG